MGRRSKGAPPAVRIHKPTGRAYVELAGAQVFLGQAGTTAAREAYDRVVAEYLGNARRPLPAPDSGLTLAELCEAYLNHLNTVHRPRTGRIHPEIGSHRVLFRETIALFPDLFASDLTPLRLEEVQGRLIARRNSRTQVNRQMARMKQVYKWASRRQLVPKLVHLALVDLEPLKYGQTSAPEGQARQPVAEADFRAVLDHLLPPLRAVIELLWATGARPTEILTMRTADVDRSSKVWGYTPRHHKMSHRGQARVVFLGPEAQRVLAPFLKLDREAYVFSPKDALALQAEARRAARRTPLYPSHLAAKEREQAAREAEGRTLHLADRYDEEALRKAVKRACLAAGVAVFTPYRLRHSAATRIQRELGIELARVVLGHRSLATTALYVQADLERAREAMGNIG